MPDTPDGARAGRPDAPGATASRRWWLDSRVALLALCSAMPFAGALVLVAARGTGAAAAHWPWLAMAGAISLAGLALLRRDLQRRLHASAEAVRAIAGAGLRPPHRAPPVAGAGPGDEINRMAAELERQRAEVAAALARLRQFVNMSTDWYWQTDTAHRFVEIGGTDNPLSASMIGKFRWDSPRLKPRSMDWDAYRAMVARRESIRDFLMERRQDDGDVRLIEINGDPMFDAAGVFQGYCGTGTDVTRVLRAESAASLSEARFRALIDDAPEAILVADFDSGLLTHVNEAAARLTGRTRGELLGSPALKLAARDGESDAQARGALVALARRVIGGENVVMDWSIRHADGHLVPVESRWMRLPGKGRVLRASLVDIGVRRAAEAERERLRVESADRLEQLRLIIDAMPHACIINSADHKVQVWNPAAERIFGFGRTEMLGRNSFDIITPPEARAAVDRLFGRLAAGESVGGSTNENITRDGRRILCEWSNERVVDSAGRFVGFLSLAIDVSSRVAAAEALKESEARFRQLTHLSSDWYWEQDENFRFLRTDVLGYRGDKPLGESAGMTRWERPGTRPVGTTWEAHRADLEAHRPFAHLLLELTNPRGLRSYAAVRGEPMFDDTGAFRGYRGVGADISARYRSDLMRAGERRLYESLARGAPLAELAELLCGNIESALVRPGCASVLILEGGRLRHLASPGAPAAYVEGVADGIEPGPAAGCCGAAAHDNRVVVSEDIEHDPAWEGYRDFARECGFASGWSTPVRATSGEAVATFAVYSSLLGSPPEEDLDLTVAAAALAGVLIERFRAEAAQREIDLRYRSLIELSQDGIMLSSGGVIDYANPGMARMLRAPDAASLIGTSFFDRLDEASLLTAQRRSRRVAEQGVSVGYVEMRLRADDGEMIDVEAAAGPVEIGGRRMVQSYVRDISARKWTEREMLRLNESLEQRVDERTGELTAAVRELEAFSYTVAHDLRAPLRAIDGYAKLLRIETEGGLGPAALRDLDRINANAGRMAELIDGLLEFSRLGRGTASYQRMSTAAIVAAVVAEAGNAYKHRPALQVGPLPDVFGDPAMLRQVWVNLVMNAFKFTASTPEPRVTIACDVREGEAVFAVGDNGAGFDENYAAKLFGIFQRLHSSSEFEGSGVGLAIVKRVIERHHGRVWAEGRVGGGATFRFSLPATSIASDAAAPLPPGPVAS
jgi:PAS domain S-box-containing protein